MRAQIAERLDGADEESPVADGERVLRANWTRLDGVDRACAGGRRLGSSGREASAALRG